MSANLLSGVSRGTASLTAELSARLSRTAVVRTNEPLARHTTLRVGGPADAYVGPASEADLAAALGFCREREWPFLLLGRGSNLLVRDGGFRGVVICLADAGFAGIEVTGQRLTCGAGARLKAVAHAARRHALTGLEFLEGIPGSLGGGLRMNAGAMGAGLFDVVDAVRIMDFHGQVEERARRDIPVAYRSCPLFRDHIALSAVLKAQPGSHEAIAERMSQFSQRRWSSQPAAPSAGCIFKNPSAIPAGRLIDELGLKGTRVGDAVVSPAHGNFIVNEGEATAADILALIDLVQQRAQAERGIALETEVEIVGQD